MFNSWLVSHLLPKPYLWLTFSFLFKFNLIWFCQFAYLTTSDFAPQDELRRLDNIVQWSAENMLTTVLIWTVISLDRVNCLSSSFDVQYVQIVQVSLSCVPLLLYCCSSVLVFVNSVKNSWVICLYLEMMINLDYLVH